MVEEAMFPVPLAAAGDFVGGNILPRVRTTPTLPSAYKFIIFFVFVLAIRGWVGGTVH